MGKACRVYIRNKKYVWSMVGNHFRFLAMDGSMIMMMILKWNLKTKKG
jgi:hypothetical protein